MMDKIYINGKTKIFGVIADPIDHVQAPSLYSNLWRSKNINRIMIPINVSSKDLVSVIKGLKNIPNFHGFCVTIPHKVAISKLCNELMPSAKQIGAVNVVFFDNKRRLIGENFDGKGFVSGLKVEGHAIKNKKVFISGAGGAARAIAFELVKEGIDLLTLSNRTEQKAIDLSISIKKWFPETKIFISNEPKKHDVLINTTSLGLNKNDPLPFLLDNLLCDSLVVDIIMEPSITKLLYQAKEKGLKIHQGKHMLDYQVELMEKFLTKNL